MFLADPLLPAQFLRETGEDPLAPLTARERDVVLRLARGLSTRRSPRELFLAPGTIKVHVASTLGKLGLTDRVQVWSSRPTS